MAMRHRYGYNAQTVNLGTMQALVPLGHVEVAPGETIRGTISANFHSCPLKREITTRVFADVYAFYTPFRLVWDQWPDFVSGNTTGLVVPLVSDLNRDNFEQRFTVSSNGTAFDRNTAFQRRTLNIIYDKFFAEYSNWDEWTDAQKSANNTWFAMQRPSTLECAPLGAQQATTITAASLAVDDIREAFARDTFQKMRRFYGARYIDYLAALGVKADWTLLTEPELIGQKHTDWKFRRVAANTSNTTPAVVLGQTAGYLASGVTVPIKRTFCPEHGLITFMAVARADAVFRASPVNPLLAKTTKEQFWSPERGASLARQRWDAQVFVNIGGTPGAAPFWEFPEFEEYRLGLNQYGQVNDAGALFEKSFTFLDDSSAVPKDRDYYRKPVAGNMAAINFDVSFLNNYSYQATSQIRLTRDSPIPRNNAKSARVI